MSDKKQDLCAEVTEQLARVVDGSAPAELYEHIADCDDCRDVRHSAMLVAERVAQAGGDFRAPAGFVDRLIAGLERSAIATPNESTASSEPATAASEPATAASEPATTSSEPATQASEPATEASEPATQASEPATASSEPATTSSEPATASSEPATQASEKSTVRQVPSRRLPTGPRRAVLYIGLAATLAAAAAVGLWVKSSHAPLTALITGEPWAGTVKAVRRASADDKGGLLGCRAPDACEPLDAEATVEPGMTLRTDARTRAFVTLRDGTELAMDRATELELPTGGARRARLIEGALVADVAHIEGSRAHFAFPLGDVEVLGTKLSIAATQDRASVEVARGNVRVTSAGESVEVRAGEEATVLRGRPLAVTSVGSLSDAIAWSDRSAVESDGPALRGLGELRARKPGQTTEKDRAVRLTKHDVKVRIVDVVARTEVDETFTNDTDEELEGIFRFPLPPGAQIERLALEVDGELIHGAFVDRDRGAAIWRGVIHNAAPKAPRPRDEIVWVPGPWRDPALLEWQRGGRFELKIFPIPKRGSRRVVLTYTERVNPSGGLRRYTYPLAHDASGTTKIDDFNVDLQVLGADPAMGVTTYGYELAPPANRTGELGERRVLHASNFVPAGDLTVEYALPDRDHEVTTWAYQAAPANDLAVAKAKTPEARAAAEAAMAMASDPSAYVAIALRPKLPRWSEGRERLHVLVVDASRSMVGERYSRATRLAASIVREMDRRDSFLVLACDTTCRTMAPEGGRMSAPSAASADEVTRFLSAIEPDGGSDLAAAMSAARAAAGSLGGRELRVLYLGDGTPTVGPTRSSHVELAVRTALPPGSGSVVAVALGADADAASLEALARGGGGVMVPYVPGQRVSSAALDVLSAAYGLVLRDPDVELPSGLTQVTPAVLDPIRAGGETFVLARMTGSEVTGSVKLRGRVAGEAFEQSYPVTITATASAGNAFVPRLYAAAKIAELEQLGGEAQKSTIIELSKRFAVASRYTSLLVLESEAMFNAFGLDRSAQAPMFTGEERAESASTDGEIADAEAKDKQTGKAESEERGYDLLDDLGIGSGGSKLRGDGSGQGRGGPAGASVAARPAPTSAAPAPAWASPPPPADLDRDRAARRPPQKKPTVADERNFERQRPPGMVPMRKVYDRKARFDAANTLAEKNQAKLIVAETSAKTAPDSRKNTTELYGLYATTGRLREAEALTTRWSERDALDPEALLARADLAARSGDRERAIRVLGGLVDVRPNDRAAQARLAELHDRAGETALACQHRIALADLTPSEATATADAVRCARTEGMVELAQALQRDAGEGLQAAIERMLERTKPPPALIGDIQLTADWSSSSARGADLDVALIDARGRRYSWLGSPAKTSIAARDVTSTDREALSFSNLPAGEYVVEITRGSSDDVGQTIRGELTLKLVGETRKIPFAIEGVRAEIGSVRVFFTSRLVPVGPGDWGLR